MNEQITVQQVMELLAKGMDPAELLQYGISQEMIQQAMMMLQEEMQEPQEGLAQRMVQPQRQG